MAEHTASEFIAQSVHKSNHDSPRSFVISHIIRHPFVALMIVFGAFSNAALASIVPVYVGEGIEALINNDDFQRMTTFALLIVGSQLIRGFLQYLRNFGAEIYAQRIERDVRDELYASLLGKDMTYHDYQPVGEIMARVTNDVREMNFMMNPGFNLIVGSSMFIFLPIVVSYLIYPPLVLVPLLFLLGFGLSAWRYIQKLRGVAQNTRKSFGKMNARLAETLEGVEVVKGLAQEDQEMEQFNGLANTVRDYSIEQGDIEAKYLPNLLIGLAEAGAFIHAIILFRAGIIDISQVIAFIGQIALFGFPVFSSLFSLSRVASGFAGAERILAVITAETHLDQNLAGQEQEVKGAIEFDNVTFGYNEDNPILRGVSFRVEPGQTLAVVGQTGAGKSTLSKLINRTYDVQDGRVLLDGVDVRDWNLASVRQQISIIEQEIFLFSRTIAENIAFGRADATQEEIEEAAKKAQAHEFITGFPEGYETVIGQRGVTLSGGQRQRLAIARAFVTDPQVLILDDSTSAIDSATEDRIQKAIWAAAKGRTTLLITHRLSQIRWADHIIVLEQGKVVASGNHDKLLESSESYRRIFARYESDMDEPRQDTMLAKKSDKGESH